MKTYQENIGLTAEQAYAWLMLEGFTLWGKPTNGSNQGWRELRRDNAVLCRNTDNRDDNWDFLFNMAPSSEVPCGFDDMDNEDILRAYYVAQVAAGHGYSREVYWDELYETRS